MARTIDVTLEIPVGVITSLCGAPFFLYLLAKTRRGGDEAVGSNMGIKLNLVYLFNARVASSRDRSESRQRLTFGALFRT